MIFSLKLNDENLRENMGMFDTKRNENKMVNIKMESGQINHAGKKPGWLIIVQATEATSKAFAGVGSPINDLL